MRPEETSAAATVAGCSVVQTFDDRGVPRVEVSCPSGWAAARFLLALASADALSDPVVRGFARKLRGYLFDDEAYARAIHSWALREIAFERERGEVFQAPAITIKRGKGDCDCHARLIFALLVAGGVPARLVFLHRGRSPVHVVAQALVRGRWTWLETTVKKRGGARFGEHPVTAAKRVGVIRDDVRGDMREAIMGGSIGVEGGGVYRMRVGVLAPRDAASERAIEEGLRQIGFVDVSVWTSGDALPADFPPNARDEMPEAVWTAWAEGLYARPESAMVEMPIEVPANAREGLISLVLDDLTEVRRVEPVTEVRSKPTTIGSVGVIDPKKANPRMVEAWPILIEAARALGVSLSGEALAISIAIGMLETLYANAPYLQANNWGNVTHNAKRGEPFVSWGYLQSGDKDGQGNAVTRPFQRYPSRLEGAKDFLRVKLGGGLRGAVGREDIRNAFARADVDAIALAMFRNGYFEGLPLDTDGDGVRGTERDRALQYANAIRRHLDAARASAPVGAFGRGGVGPVVALLPWLALGSAIWYTIRSS